MPTSSSIWGNESAAVAAAPLATASAGFAQTMLSAQARRLHHLIDAIPQFVWTANAEGRLLYANSAWRACVGPHEAQPVEVALLRSEEHTSELRHSQSRM